MHYTEILYYATIDLRFRPRSHCQKRGFLVQVIDNSTYYIKRGSAAYVKMNTAFFLAGFTIFAILYSVQPLMPYFVRHFHITEATASWSLSITTLTLAISLLFYGALSEVIGRKNIMIFSVVSVSVLALIQPLCSSFTLFLMIRCIQGFCLAGLPAIAMAYVSEEVSPEDIGGAIGLYISGNALGGTFGRVFTVGIASISNWTVALFAMAAISVVASAMFIYLLPNSKHFHAKTFALMPLLKAYQEHASNPQLLKPFFLGFLLLGGNVALFNYIGFRLREAPYLLSNTMISFIYLLFLIGMISAALNAKIVQRFGKMRTLKLTIVLFSIGTLITLWPSLIVKIIGLSFVVFAFFSGHSLASSAVGQLAKQHTAQATSLYLLFYYSGSSIGGILGGLFWVQAGWSGVVGIVTFLLVFAYAIAHSMQQ